MQAVARLTPMEVGKWSDRVGGDDAPYMFVDLYDRATGQMFTWSIPEDLEAPPFGSDIDVHFELSKQARPALTQVKKGARKGETMEFVQEKLKVKVLSFGKAPAKAAETSSKAA